MRPGQFGAQCVPNWEKLIKMPHTAQLPLIEALAKFTTQLF